MPVWRFIENQLDWTSANNACIDQSSTLPSIDSAFDNNEMLINAKNLTGCSQIFIGLQQQSSNLWSWVNNDTSSYRNWQNGKA
uniref:C-type lectin domain-containing protein n=1 Tax=Acrobeloides nanus TaxID=290746 RepID=A0A914CZB5_9BILA